MSVDILIPSPRVNMLDRSTTNTKALCTPEKDGGELPALPAVCGPHRGTRRPSGTNESDTDSPPSKRSKNSRRRRKRPRKRIQLKGLRTKPVAPFNTTQFLMAEHDHLKDKDMELPARPRRRRDSSFSVDSDDQDFYSSPEDEDEFMAKEFWNAYEDVHAERLDTMTKAQLVQEYLALEEKVDVLEMQLRAVRARRRCRSSQVSDDEEELRPGEVKVDSETAQKITIFQNEINKLEMENKKLREENFTLARRTSSAMSSSSSSSSDSSSDSSSSSSSSDSSSDSDSDAEAMPNNNNVKSSIDRTKISTPASPSGNENIGKEDDESAVSASDKVECHPADSNLNIEQESSVSGEAEPIVRGSTATPTPEEGVDAAAAATTSSCDVNKKVEDNEVEVSSTTAA